MGEKSHPSPCLCFPQGPAWLSDGEGQSNEALTCSTRRKGRYGDMEDRSWAKRAAFPVEIRWMPSGGRTSLELFRDIKDIPTGL